MIEQIVRDFTTETYEPIEKVTEKLNYYRELSKKGLYTLSDAEFENLKADVKSFFNLQVACYADTFPTRLFRITNNKNLCGGKKVKLQKISQLIGPPPKISNYQRCNLPGESIFYAALDLKTAIWETQPEVGDYVTISEWKIKPGKKIVAHSIFHPDLININADSQHASDQYNAHRTHWRADFRDTFSEVLKFFTEEFMKPVSKSRDYHFSAFLASGLLQAPPDPHVIIEAITYPSVKMKYGYTNVALKNELALEKLDLVSIKLWNVAETNYDKGVTSHEMLKISPCEFIFTKFDLEQDKIYYDGELDQLIECLKAGGSW